MKLREKRSSTRATIRNVLFKNIQIISDRLPGSDIVGFSSCNEVSDVVFKNIRFQGKVLESPGEAKKLAQIIHRKGIPCLNNRSMLGVAMEPTRRVSATS